MPFTPYHFGPAGFVGLVFRKYIDLPLFVLANVIIDVEVLFAPGRFPHRLWHFHTLLIGTIVGALFGLALYPLRGIFQWLMNLLRLSYKPTLLKMTISGALGACFHVFIDSIYHWDVQLLWPNQNARPLWNIISQSNVKIICLAFWLAAIVLYLILLWQSLRKKKTKAD
jgi:membrane-bound metal-dependent hydrolase YbcI (DUF457 family)